MVARSSTPSCENNHPQNKFRQGIFHRNDHAEASGEAERVKHARATASESEVSFSSSCSTVSPVPEMCERNTVPFSDANRTGVHKSIYFSDTRQLSRVRSMGYPRM